MLHPLRIIKANRWSGFLAVQLFVAGNLVSAIINPLMWQIFVMWLTWRPPILTQLTPEAILYLNMFALVFGNLFFMGMLMIGPLKRGWSELSVYGLTRACISVAYPPRRL